MMKTGVHMRSVRAMKALDKAGGKHLTTALRRGYSAAARLIRDSAKATSAFKSKTGKTKSSWKVTASARPFNHAKVVNTAVNAKGFPYPLFLEWKPMETKFMAEAARSTAPQQLDAVGAAVRKHLRKLQSNQTK